MWLMQFLRDLRVPTCTRPVVGSDRGHHALRVAGVILSACGCRTGVRGGVFLRNGASFAFVDSTFRPRRFGGILAEGAIALSVTLSGGALFAS